MERTVPNSNQTQIVVAVRHKPQPPQPHLPAQFHSWPPFPYRLRWERNGASCSGPSTWVAHTPTRNHPPTTASVQRNDPRANHHPCGCHPSCSPISPNLARTRYRASGAPRHWSPRACSPPAIESLVPDTTLRASHQLPWAHHHTDCILSPVMY